MENRNSEWFAGWFDSPYYHLLYGHRDEQEAFAFIQLLVHDHLADRPYVVDLGCGKGRHSRALAEHGKRVHGIDLSPESIEFASKQNTAMATFSVQDMRQLTLDTPADAILNLFTSFGYFESVDEHLSVLSSVAANLKKGGLFILDYFNAHLVEEGSGTFT
ncbi:MAG: class I SAM-dependent methyltransferase, partial [Flavobacteriales bacterium]